MAAYAVAVAAVLAVFVLYTHPATMVAISDMVWACFN
jgi:hypothetical protein